MAVSNLQCVLMAVGAPEADIFPSYLPLHQIPSGCVS
jgi:hypothetical protein